MPIEFIYLYLQKVSSLLFSAVILKVFFYLYSIFFLKIYVRSRKRTDQV